MKATRAGPGFRNVCDELRRNDLCYCGVNPLTLLYLACDTRGVLRTGEAVTMGFANNSTLVTSAKKIAVAANGSDGDVYDATAGADAFLIASGDTGDDVILSFSANDTIITTTLLSAGYVPFGLNSPLPKSAFRDCGQPGPADMIISRTPVSAATWPAKAKISAFSA